MRHLARYLALAACLTLAGSAADAAPGRRHRKAAKKAKHHAKVAPPVEIDMGSDPDAEADEAAEAERTARLAERAERKAARIARERDASEADDDQSDRVATAAPDGDDEISTESAELVDAPVKLHRSHRADAAPANDWHVAIGPYLWASSVDASISVGGASVDTGVDFSAIKKHARYGAELLGEVRYGKFSLAGDMMYGVVALSASKAVGPLMVSLDGEASTLLVDGAGGYRLLGGDRSVLSIEARGGVRYQRTELSGAVGVGGSSVLKPQHVDGGSDAIAGTRVVVRPSRRYYFTGTADVGLFGASSTTWSLAADASLRIKSRLLLSLGWRTLTIDRANVGVTMHGPRAAVQLTF